MRIASPGAGWLTSWLAVSLALAAAPHQPPTLARWQIGTPIVTYWCGLPLTESTAQQYKDGGFNLVWCGEQDLDLAARYGLRAQLHDGLIAPASLDDPARRAQLDALIDRVKQHPALYSYYLLDEPSAGQFPALARLVSYLRERDPAHLAYLNLFPTYANNEQLGTVGDTVTAYREHLRQFTAIVRPDLISYDHYQFALHKDTDQYFLNLAMIRQTALQEGVPFLNIVQACTWAPTVMRVPNADEVRYLVSTTLAYGAQGLSYYIYSCANHVGGFALADGTPTPLYHAAKSLNREFVTISQQLQPLRSLAVWHTHLRERGCHPLPQDAPFRVSTTSAPGSDRGFLIGTFGPRSRPTHAIVVNLDYRAEHPAQIVGPGRLAVFEATAGTWTKTSGREVTLTLPPGGARLLRSGR